ncbi:hypothetical protein PR202_ga00035 [Eleusine coracana subsp. coracana]|uniref:RNase H type-1 domain-containing protein n=1 Tax=Eleusine coracana subsp. coracana TaxID=191504 RepID=A0AAV5BAP3_ELECO|nr:hypothetical protein PR202_ga00035 [Eleusine coracana subsp. coracana]
MINVDGSYKETESIGGWGFVIRDNSGDVVGSCAGRIEHCTDAMHAEIMATLQALTFATEASMMRIEIEMDAINVKTTLTTQKYDLSPLSMLIRDTKFLMLSEFLETRVAYQPRACNKVADALAKFGCDLEPGGTMLWPDGNPTFVNDLVVADVQSAHG